MVVAISIYSKHMRTYYDILKISKTAGADEIKSAYRSMAGKYHPDVNSDPHAAEDFKLIGRAYNVLIDPTKRADYDQLLAVGTIAKNRSDIDIIESSGMFPAISNTLANILTFAGVMLAVSAFVQWLTDSKQILWSQTSIYSVILGAVFGLLIGFNANFDTKEIFGKGYFWFKAIFWLILLVLIFVIGLINYSLLKKSI